MDVRKKLAEMSEQLRYCANVSDCVNCKRWDKVCENQCVDNLLLMAADLIDSVAHGVTVQEWTSVKDRLPKENGIYLTLNKKRQYEFHMFQTGKRMWQGIWEEDGVTHWMPLPQPPKGE